MHSRVKTIQATKDYCNAFNQKDLLLLESMLDGKDAIFSRQGQPTIVGATQIIARTKKLFKRLDRHGHHLHMVNAIIDTKDTNARPCLLGVMDGERFSVVIISLKPNGLIASIAIILTEATVATARPIEPLEAPEEDNHNLPKPPKVKPEELAARKKDLHDKAENLMQRLQEEGPTPALMEKFKRLENSKQKVKELEEQFRNQD